MQPVADSTFIATHQGERTMGMHNQNGRGHDDNGRRDFRPQQDQRDEQGQGQSGYAAGRQVDDPSLQFRNRNQAQSRGGEDPQQRGYGNTDDRFTGRGGEDYGMDRDRGGGGDRQRPTGAMGTMGAMGYHNSQMRDVDVRDRGPYDDSGRGARSWNPQDPYRESSGGQSGGGQYGGGQYGGGQSGGGASGMSGGQRMPSQPGQHRGKGPQGYQRSDERIREHVCEALTDDEHLDATNIQVTVKDGEVTLAGTVEDRAAKRMAEDIAERCSGVRDVTNQLKVGGNDPKTTGNQMGNGSVEKPKARA